MVEVEKQIVLLIVLLVAVAVQEERVETEAALRLEMVVLAQRLLFLVHP